MNGTLATLTLITGVFATLAVSSLKAESEGVANIPFAFHVKSRVLPAGKYEIGKLSASDAFLLKITDGKGHSSVVSSVPTTDANPADPKLTFACLRGACTLVKMDLPGSNVSHEIPAASNYTVVMAAMIRIPVAH